MGDPVVFTVMSTLNNTVLLIDTEHGDGLWIFGLYLVCIGPHWRSYRPKVALIATLKKTSPEYVHAAIILVQKIDD